MLTTDLDKIYSLLWCYFFQFANEICWLWGLQGSDCEIIFYYIDRSVLLENTPLVAFIRNYIQDPSGVFSISSLVRILMTSFPACLYKHSVKIMARERFIFLRKSKLHGGLKILILFSRVINIYLKYRYHFKIKFISSRRRVISSM